MAKKIPVRVFDDLRNSLQDALAFEQGRVVDLRTTRIPSPPKAIKPAEIRRIRLALNATQRIFAAYLNVSANAVRSWEQGVRHPQQAALKLLMVARRHPQALLQL